VVLEDWSAGWVLLVEGVLPPPQALSARAATQVIAAEDTVPNARLCMESPLKPGGTRRHQLGAP
jgi:hypothetical protein